MIIGYFYMKLYLIKTITLILFCAAVFVSTPVQAQQFSSDSYISKPHGMATVIMTAGERNIMTMTTFSLFPRWEFTFAAYIYREDRNSLTDDGYSTSIYAKYMFYENAAKTGGFAMSSYGILLLIYIGFGFLEKRLNLKVINFPMEY